MSNLHLNKDCLKAVLDRAGNRKLTFLSVVGPIGTGKSLLMSLVVRYLKSVEHGNEARSPDWLFPKDASPLQGFPFKNSIDAVTSGIQIWPEPFFIGEDTALFVIDTPGFYGSETTFREWGGIVASTILLSSCTIFNVTKQLEEDCLTALTTFLEMAKFISSDFDSKEDSNVKSFEKIIFLIRDWNNPSEFKYGCGQDFLNKKLASDSGRISAEAAQVRVSLKSSVEELHCFLLPRPDNANIEFGKILSPQSLGEAFATHLRQFMESFINPSQIKPKTFKGIALTVTGFLEMIENNLKNFNHNLTPIPNLTDVSIQMHMELSVLRNVEFYKSTMTRKLSKKSIPRPSHVEKIHADLKPYILETFQTTHRSKPEVVTAYLPSLSNQLDSSYERFRQQVLLNLQHFVSEAAGAAVKAVRSEIVQLSITELGSACTFEKVFTSAKSSAVQSFLQKFKSLDSEFRNSWEQSLNESFSSLLAELQDYRETQIAAVVLANEPFLQEALTIYSAKVELTLDTDEGYVSTEKLDRYHKSAVAVASKFLLTKTTIPEPAFEVREMLLKKLVESAMQEYSQLKQTNDRALLEVQKSWEGIENSLVVRTESDISDILSKNGDPASAILELKQLQSDVTKNELESLGCNNNTFNCEIFEKKLICKLQSLVHKAVLDLEAKILQHQTNELEVRDASFQSFLRKSIDISSQIQDPEELELMLLNEKESELSVCEVKLANLQSIKISERLQSLSHKIGEESRKVIASNNQRIQTLESEFDDIANGTIADLTATLENSLNNANVTSSDKLSLKLEYLDSINTRTSHILLPQKCLRKNHSKVEGEIDKALENYSRVFATCKQDQVKAVTNSVVAAATKMFAESMQGYCKEYTVLDQSQYQNECERLREDLVLELKIAADWSTETFQEVQKAVREELDKEIQTFWMETVVQTNRKAEHEIQNKMAALKTEFSGKVAASTDREGLLKCMVSTFKSDLDCSSKTDHARFCELLSKDLRVILDATEAKLQKIREVELASDKLIQQFRDSAPNHKGLHDLQTEKIKKFEEVTESYDLQLKFKKEIEAVMQDILKSRRDKASNIKKINDFTENLIKEFKSTLQSKGSDNVDSLKMELGEKLVSEAQTAALDPAEFLSRLSEGMQTCYRDFEERVKQQVEEVVREIVEIYSDWMSLRFSSAVYFTPNELANMHGEATREAFAKCSNCKIKSKEVQIRLKKELDTAYEEFNSKNAMNTPTSFAVGIDLGTTYSCVGVYTNGTVEIIPNDLGKKTTPSYVFFEESGDTVVGEAAKNQAHMYPERTVYEVKRLIGRTIDDQAIQGDLKKWPYKVVAERGNLKVQIGERQTYHPEEVSAEVLKKLKKCAEDYLCQDVDSAVITVPAYFTEGQKSATKRAGEAAGLHVLRILTEPTAAAIAYNLNWKGGRGSSKGMVYDLGGGTFDVAVFTATRGSIDIVNVGGDTHLGGVDFDNELVEHCIQDFRGQTGIDLMAGKDSTDWRKKKEFNRKIMRLKRKCEEYKIGLTQADFITVAIDSIHEGEDLLVKITRAQFETMIEKHIQNSLNTVQEVLQDAKMTKDEIDEIVLVGGSTRIPKVQSRLMDFFGKALNRNINPDEAVAVGAAYEAAVLNGKRAQENGDIRSAAVAPRGMSIKDITPMAYGIEVQNGEMFVLIPKQSKVPTEMAENFTTHYHQQTSVLIVIYEGDGQKVVENTKVGEFFLNGIPPGLAGRQQIRVTMRVDWNGMITVAAVCLENGVQKNLTVRANRRGMSK
ncbi:unnamed protein product [Allacma fusca]|uniref:Guanylate-binding protein N-terminal domain-containing protein n=1 Tax=Allacma fusca TaxID=39272 RepID=A0A8J2P768_9HEXA|nr:unnamed protein product [Allacma fusca]